MTEVQSVTGGGSNTVSGAGDGDARAGRIAEENQVNYIPGEHRFQVMLDGKPTDISPMEAVCLVLQQRYITMSDVTAQKTREMQEQVNQINEANAWLNAVKNAGDDGKSFKPPTVSWQNLMKNVGDDDKSLVPLTDSYSGLKKWMTDHGLDTTGVEDPPDADGVKKAEGEIGNYIDQLSSTNDLKMLSLKTAMNKSQEALTAADGVLQDLKQLMQLINNNMGR